MFSGHSIVEDSSGILRSSPRTYFLLETIKFTEDFNFWWEEEAKLNVLKNNQ